MNVTIGKKNRFANSIDRFEADEEDTVYDKFTSPNFKNAKEYKVI